MVSTGFERLKGQVSIVTGAAQGLGEALASRLCLEGSKVIVADINFEKAQETSRRLKGAIPFKVDVSDGQQVNELVNLAMDEYGRLDLMVSNAAILISGGVDEITPPQWRRMMDINVTGYYLCARAAARVMIPAKKGNIIQINSKSGKKGSYKNSAYATTKFAGIGLTQSLALELAEHNIRVNAICPGNLLDSPLWVDSLYEQYAKNQGITVEEVREKYLRQVPLGRGCTYDDVANVLVFLTSEEASYMTGQAVNVTGGQEMR